MHTTHTHNAYAYKLRVQAMGTDPGDAPAVVRSLLRLLEGGDNQRDKRGGVAEGGDTTRDEAGDKSRDEALCAALLSQWRRSLWRKGSSTAGGLHTAGRRVKGAVLVAPSTARHTG